MTEWLEVTERSAVAEARRRTLACASAVGLDPTDRDRAAIVATEATTNLLKHAGRGRFALYADADGHRRPELRVLALDKGPGISDLDRLSQDGASTVGSAGTGLGAMARQSDGLDIHTGASGTVVVARVAARGAALPSVDLEVAVLMDVYPGAAVCGDAYAVRRDPNGATLMVCDGLGHGPAAHEAAKAVQTAFFGADETSPARLLPMMGAAAASTRGAVASVVRFEGDTTSLRTAGVGNISGLIVSNGRARRLPSRDGRLGGPVPRLEDNAETLEPGDLLILHSDGIRTLRDIAAQSGLFARSPLAIAAVLLRDDARGNDDACVLVARRSDGGPRR